MFVLTRNEYPNTCLQRFKNVQKNKCKLFQLIQYYVMSLLVNERTLQSELFHR